MSALHGGESNAIDGITEADDAVSGDAIVSSWENSNIKIRRAKVTKIVTGVLCCLYSSRPKCKNKHIQGVSKTPKTSKMELFLTLVNV